MLKNFKEVIDNLTDCEAYIQDVIVSIHTPTRISSQLT